MLRILYVALETSPAADAARNWLHSRPDFTTLAVSAGHAADALHEFRPGVVWLDGGVPGAEVPAELEEILEIAPGLLLTGAAAGLPHHFHREPVAPRCTHGVWRNADDDLFLFDTFSESPRLRGHAAFRRHPLFHRLGSATFTWRAVEGEPWSAVRYCAPAWPARARVIAVERAYIHINAQRATIWEHRTAPDTPRVLCIGAYLNHGARDVIYRPSVERLTANALRFVAGGLDDSPARYWQLPRGITTRDDTPPALELPVMAGDPLPFQLASLTMDGSGADDPFTLAGRRLLVAGTERAGVNEIWVHPLRILRDLRVRVDDTPLRCQRVRVTSLGIERHDEHRLVTERCAAPADAPAALFEWSLAHGEAAVELTWETDLRLMWPYPAGALGPLRWHVEGRAATVRGDSGQEVACFLASDENCEWNVDDVSSDDVPRLRFRLRCRLSGDRALRFAALAAESPAALRSALATLRDPSALVAARAATQRRIRNTRLTIRTPEGDVDDAVEWAKLRLDSYLVYTPGVGRSLVAGYSQSTPGWGDGRPGYAWYFGRDAVWTALASLAAGDFAASRDVLTFLARHQDRSGKILHEATTSGVVHYDAADATPLYLLLAARHHAWTGDIEFLRRQWPYVRRALAFCQSTDLDEDGLIENTGVGHGWIEFGPLGGGRVTYYNAGIWTAALRELAVTAEAIGEPRDAAELASQAKRARLALEQLFHQRAAGYALKAWTDERGEWQRDFTPTATHAVPLLLEVADAGRAAGWLDRVASEDFSAPWGVRMVARSDPVFDPRSYHGGAVWPLYTGWVSWAEFAAGRPEAAIAHWRANIRLASERAKGAWDEVLHGTELRSAGVCPDQAWSTAMAIAPLVYGMLGAEPDAARMRLRLRPQLPREWDHFECHNLAMGDAVFSLHFAREGSRHTFTLEQTGGAVPARVIFEPTVPGESLDAAHVDGQPAALDPRPFGDRLRVPAQLVMDHVRVMVVQTSTAGD